MDLVRQKRPTQKQTNLIGFSSQEVCVLNSDLCPPNVTQQQPVNMLHSKNFPTPTTTVFGRGTLVSNAKRQMSLHLTAAAPPSSTGATLTNAAFHVPMPPIPSASNSVTGSPTNRYDEARTFTVWADAHDGERQCAVVSHLLAALSPRLNIRPRSRIISRRCTISL